MIAYIIRRLLAAAGTLFVVSVLTFGIFYMFPRLAGATPETLASRYVGRSATVFFAWARLSASCMGFFMIMSGEASKATPVPR